jgi:hypothetical protein
LRSAIADISNENDITENANMKGTGQEEKSDGIMKYTLNSNIEISYVYFNDSENKFEAERNVLDIITALAENNMQFVLLDSETLSKYTSKPLHDFIYGCNKGKDIFFVDNLNQAIEKLALAD